MYNKKKPKKTPKDKVLDMENRLWQIIIQE